MQHSELASYFINGNANHVTKSWQIVLNSYSQYYMIIVHLIFNVDQLILMGFCLVNSHISAAR